MRLTLAAIAAIWLIVTSHAFGQSTTNRFWTPTTTATTNSALTGSISPMQPAPPTPISTASLSPTNIGSTSLVSASVPSSTVAPLASASPYLGVQITDAAGAGLVVAAVVPGGPCEVAGLRTGDIVRAANDQPVRTNAELTRIVSSITLGSALKLSISRAGVEQALSITPTQRTASLSPTAPIGGPRNRGLGVTIGPVTPMNRAWLRLPDLRGAVVTGLYTGAPAYRAGIPHNAVIVAVDGRPINTPADLRGTVGTIEAGRPVPVKYYDRGQLTEKVVTLDAINVPAPTGTAVASTLQPRVANSVGAASQVSVATSADHQAQEVRRLEQRVAEMERKLRELETQMGSR